MSDGPAFVHDSRDWDALLLIVATAVKRDVALVEKDYWVTHALWAIHEQGFEVWFKGGTSLSKGFGLIERFSEDIDARLDSGTTGLAERGASTRGSPALRSSRPSRESSTRASPHPSS